jgi:hypothetical protein
VRNEGQLGRVKAIAVDEMLDRSGAHDHQLI